MDFPFIRIGAAILFFCLAGCRKTDLNPVPTTHPEPRYLLPDGSVALSEAKSRYTDPFCESEPCGTVIFTLPKTGTAPPLDSVIDSAAVAAWGRNFASPELFSQSIFREWHEDVQEYHDESDYSPDAFAGEPRHLITKGSVLLNTEGLLSLRFDLENRFSEQLVSYDCAFLNLNTCTGKPIRLSDIFRPQTNDLFIAIAEEAFYSGNRFRLNADLESCQLRLDRCRFSLPEYISFTQSALVLEYRPDEIAPAWMGNPPVVIPYARLQHLINPEGPLAWALEQIKPAKGLRQKLKDLRK